VRMSAVYVSDFSGYGFRIEGHIGVSVTRPGVERPVTVNTNADHHTLYDCRAQTSGEDGFYIAGDDANAGILANCRSSVNSGAQFRDRSFLGTSFVGCNADAGPTGDWGFHADRAGSPTTSAYVGCYNEASAPSYFSGPIQVRGGPMTNVARNSMAAILEAYGEGGYCVSRPTTFVNNWLPYHEWWPHHRYETGDKIFVRAPQQASRGYVYTVTEGGGSKSGMNQPANFPTIVGQSTPAPDGGLTWTCTAEEIDFEPTVFWPGGRSQISAVNAPSPGLRIAFSWGQFTREPTGGAVHTYFDLARDSANGRWELSWTEARYAYGLTDLKAVYPRHGAFVLPEVWIGDLNVERRIAVAYAAPTTAISGGVGFYSVGDLILNAATTDPWAWRVVRPGGIPSFGPSLTWTPNTAYPVGSLITPTTDNQRVYRARTNGTTGSAQPAWTATIGQIQPADGTVEWECWGYTTDFLEPLPSRAAAQADSTATSIAELVTDFNALLAKLRAANVLA
jgi:hypothetical protein